MTAPTIFTMLPVGDGDDPYGWRIERSGITTEGPVSALLADMALPDREAITAIALVPAHVSTFRRVKARGLAPQQEIAVARITAQEAALGQIYAAAALDGDGKLAVATVDRDTLQSGLERLSRHGLTISAAAPMAAILAPDVSALYRLELGGHALLRATDIAFPDEPELAGVFVGNLPVHFLSSAEISAALVAFAQGPKPDFLDGMPMRKARKLIFSDASRLWTKRLIALAAILVFVGELVHWAKLRWAISQENNAALSAAQTTDPAITDIAQAEASVDAALARNGVQKAKPAILIAVVWQSAKASENLAIADMNLAEDGMLKATLSAPDADSINKALLSIQRAGYRITATPRRDQSGLTLVDLTVRAP